MTMKPTGYGVMAMTEVDLANAEVIVVRDDCVYVAYIMVNENRQNVAYASHCSSLSNWLFNKGAAKVMYKPESRLQDEDYEFYKTR